MKFKILIIFMIALMNINNILFIMKDLVVFYLLKKAEPLLAPLSLALDVIGSIHKPQDRVCLICNVCISVNGML